MKFYIILPTLIFVQLSHGIQLLPILVESSKTDDTLLNSPQSIDIISADQMEIKKIQSINDLNGIIANTNVSGLGNRSDTTFSIRGISNYVATESSVAMYIDDVSVPMSYGFGTIDMSNVDAIEMYKGAQGTLFGKNAESGVINIYTKPVSEMMESEAHIDIGEYNSREFYGRVSGPSTIDKVGFSFALTKKMTDGYSENLLTNHSHDRRDLQSASAKLSYLPSNHLNLALSYTKTKINDGGTAFKIDTKDDPYRITNEPKEDSVVMDNDLLSLVVKSVQNSYSITSATGYSSQNIQKQDYVAILGGLDMAFDINIKEISQEFRLNGAANDFEYFVGVFYSDKIEFNYKENQTFTAIPSYNNANVLDNLDRNIALFGEFQYALSNHFSFNTGLRYQQTTRDFRRDYSGFSSEISSTITSHEWLPMVSLSYGEDDYNTYLTYTKGYRPGGYNYRSSGAALIPYESETTQSYEVGYKQFFKNWKMTHALFYNDISNLRTIVFDNTLATQTKNAQSAYSYGIESSLNYISDTLSIYGSFGLTRAKYDTFVSNGIDYSGKHLIEVPDMTFSLGGNYFLDAHWYANGAMTYMGKRYYDVDNIKEEKGYVTCNGGFGYKTKQWNAEVYATNLFGSENVDFMIHTPAHDYYHFASPRIIGFKAEYLF